MNYLKNHKEHLWRVVKLSIPAVLAQVSSIIMQYIDAAMAGSLGAKATAAIGLISSTTWLFGGLCMAAAAGFSVQTAQLIGAGEWEGARRVLRQALLCTFLFGLALSAIGIGISSFLPLWLGGRGDVARNSSRYFLFMPAPFLPCSFATLRVICSSAAEICALRTASIF